MTTTTSVRFGRLERHGVLLGLTGVQLALVGSAMVIATSALYSRGLGGLAVASPAWGLLVAAGTVRVAGRPLTAWGPISLGWHGRRATGRTRELTAPTAPSAMRVPGIAVALQVTLAPASGAALVWDRRTSTVTAIAAVRGSGFVLVDPAAQEQKVATWGRVLAQLCQQTAVVRVQVLLRTVPATAGPTRQWWRRESLDDGSLPSRVLADLLDQADRDAVRHETFIVLAVRSPHGASRRPTDDHARQVEQTLGAVAVAVAAADLHLDRWIAPHDLTGVLAAAYDPTLPEHPEGHGPSLPTMGVTEAWDHLRTDTAVHATFWVSEWPRTPVGPSFLQPLVLGPAWRTLSLVAEPLPTGKALREIRRAHVEHAADAAHRARVGMIEDEAVRAERADLADREAELVAGHGDLRFTGLITVSAPDLDALDAACQVMRSTAAQAFCEVRPLVGQQASAHLAGAVPLARGVR